MYLEKIYRDVNVGEKYKNTKPFPSNIASSSPEYKEMRDEWRAEEQVKQGEFLRDLLLEAKITYVGKDGETLSLYPDEFVREFTRMAWDRGHSSGPTEVVSCAEDMLGVCLPLMEMIQLRKS